MHRFVNRFLCLFLIVCIVFTQAVVCAESAENADTATEVHPNVSSTDFSFDLSMDASGFPESDQKFLQGYADLVNLLSVRGTFQLANDTNGCFDVDACVIVHGKKKDSEIPVHLYGNKNHWLIESKVLGDDMTVMLNLDGFLEFSMKAFSYLNVPMQNAVLWLVPYTTLKPVKIISRALRKLTRRHKTRKISENTVFSVARKLSETFDTNRNLHYWLMALGNESGYDEMLLEDLTDLKAYAESFISDKGIRVTVTDTGETWKAGYRTLFTRETDDTSEKWSLSLPKTPYGSFRTEASFEKSMTDQLLQCAGKLSVKSTEMGNAIDLSVRCKDFPLSLPVSVPFSASVEVKGEMRPEERFVLSGQGDGTGSVTLSLSSNKFEFLTLTGTMTESEPTFRTHVTNKQALKGFNLLSVNDATLKEFLNKVSGPLIRELLPVMIDVPASTYQSFLDFLSKYSILTLLTYGMSGE